MASQRTRLYDPLYRLTAVTEAGGSVLESVTYNSTGDQLSKTGTGLATGAYSYNPDAEPPHAHVNDPSGQRLDINGNPVPPESPDAHLPIGK